MGRAGNTSNALASGGFDGTATNVTEEWTGAGAPIGAWSTGGDLNTAREKIASASAAPSTNSFAFSGESPGTDLIGNSENYNSMLKVTDFAGVVRSSNDFILNLKRKKNVYYSNSLAPLGWKNVLLKMDPIKKLKLG